jgi:hypothetical protein
MEYHARKCERCEEFDPITVELPLHYARRESTIDFEDARCDRCLFELDRQLFDVQEIVKLWNITCEHVGGSLYVVFATCEYIVIFTVVHVIYHVNVEMMIVF